MNLRSQIEKLTTTIKDLEEQSANLQVESFALRQQREELFARLIVEEKLLNETEWELTMNGSSGVNLSIKGDSVNKLDFVRKIAQTDYHSWFEIADGIQLRFDDSDISISFKETKQVMPFVKKNGLKISGSTITTRLSQLKRDVAALEVICHQLSLDNKK